jgi:peptidoglycan/xylan/chitin deacetylase (PgdA/CDA1 family)
MTVMQPLFSLLSPAGSGARLSILIWHRVLPRPDPIFPDEMHAARFDQTLAWLKQAFRVLPLPEAIAGLKAGRLPNRAAAITFDDGYEDNYSVAMPLLKKHGLDATFFITTGFIDGGRMWNDSIIETVRRAPDGLLDAGRFGQHALGDAVSRRCAIDALIGQIKYLDMAERQAVVDGLAQQAGVQLPQDLMMSAAQVRAMHAAGMTIGAHTRSHPILSRLSLPDARDEIATGRDELEAMIGARVGLFAYPNGRPHQDYEREHVSLVRELGFDAAVSTAWGASRPGDDLFQLRRFTPWDTRPLAYGLRMARNYFANGQFALA